MATIIRIKETKADELHECAKKLYRGAKKLMDFVEEEILDNDEMDERGCTAQDVAESSSDGLKSSLIRGS